MTKQSFESAIKKLEKIIGDLEGGDLPLERAVKKFEEGMRLSAYCSRVLDETERKISLLIEDADGQVCEVPFEKSES